MGQHPYYRVRKFPPLCRVCDEPPWGIRHDTALLVRPPVHKFQLRWRDWIRIALTGGIGQW